MVDKIKYFTRKKKNNSKKSSHHSNPFHDKLIEPLNKISIIFESERNLFQEMVSNMRGKEIDESINEINLLLENVNVSQNLKESLKDKQIKLIMKTWILLTIS